MTPIRLSVQHPLTTGVCDGGAGLASGPRTWRTRTDPFEKVWPMVELWLNEPPDANAKDLFLRLQANTAEVFQPGQLRTLQRRVKQWRSEIARRLVFGAVQQSESEATFFDGVGTGCSN